PRASSTTKATMVAVITASPAIAVAWMSISRNRSSRPSPRRPRIVSLRPPRRTIAPKPAMIASETSPPFASPPIHCAAKPTPPRATENNGRNHFDLAILIEHLLDSRSEEPGERERERQRGRVALLLDRVDRLARDAQRRRQVTLGQRSLCPQLAHPIPHRARLCRARVRRETAPTTTAGSQPIVHRGAKLPSRTVSAIVAPATITAATSATVVSVEDIDLFTFCTNLRVSSSFDSGKVA